MLPLVIFLAIIASVISFQFPNKNSGRRTITTSSSSNHERRATLPLPSSFTMKATSSATEVTSFEQITKVPGGTFIDEADLLSKSTFAIKPDELIRLTKKVLLKGAGVDDPSVLADDFEFCAPVVGPLKKEEYLSALKSFDLMTAFPDLENSFYNVHVDPFEFNRVWWSTRATATHTGPLFNKPPTYKRLQLPPQTNSFTFNEEGLVTQITVGYVLDRRVGNTGGLGGAFAFFYGTNNALPIPECQPYRKSFQFRALNLISKFIPKK